MCLPLQPYISLKNIVSCFLLISSQLLKISLLLSGITLKLFHLCVRLCGQLLQRQRKEGQVVPNLKTGSGWTWSHHLFNSKGLCKFLFLWTVRLQKFSQIWRHYESDVFCKYQFIKLYDCKTMHIGFTFLQSSHTKNPAQLHYDTILKCSCLSKTLVLLLHTIKEAVCLCVVLLLLKERKKEKRKKKEKGERKEIQQIQKVCWNKKIRLHF